MDDAELAFFVITALLMALFLWGLGWLLIEVRNLRRHL